MCVYFRALIKKRVCWTKNRVSFPS